METASPRADGIAEDACRDLLARGLSAGVITQDQAHRLAALAAPEPAAVPRDDEALRLVSGFADIFVTIGLGLLFGAIVLLEWSAAGFAIIAALAWALAEFFTRRRRMALPSIVLLVVLAWAVFVTFTFVFEVRYPPTVFGPSLRYATAPDLFGMTAAAMVTVGATALHYRRFRVPITIAAGTASLLGALLALLLGLVPGAREHLNPLLLAAGIATFALALRFDLSDPTRLTRASDIAFWLHLLAAPLIVHPVLQPLTMSAPGDVTPGTAAGVLGIVVLLSVVALVTDRRAMLVSGLAYAGIALGSLIRQSGVTTWTFPMTILCLGAFVLLLSAGWHPLRRLALRLVPERIRARLPHPVGG